jgi:hypothetical protein
MKDYYIATKYDGRLPMYEVVEVETKITKVIKTFDNETDAEKYLESLTRSEIQP